MIDDFELESLELTGDSKGEGSFSLDVAGDSSGATEGDDYIENIENGIDIHALGGNDTINNTGSGVTIDGGTGNDFMYNEGADNVVFAYNSGDGNDFIVGFNDSSTLSSGDGKGLTRRLKAAIILSLLSAKAKFL